MGACAHARNYIGTEQKTGQSACAQLHRQRTKTGVCPSPEGSPADISISSKEIIYLKVYLRDSRLCTPLNGALGRR